MTHQALTNRLTALNAEWAELARQPPPRAWRTESALRGIATLAEVLHTVRANPDAALLALLRRQAAGDVLAGRCVLQAMLGKLVRLAVADPVAVLDDYLAAAWERIATYPVDRRPCRVAANLALDALKSVKRQRARETLALPAWRLGSGPATDDPHAVLEAGERLGLIDAATRRVLTCVYVEGRTSRSAAARLGTSADAVRWRCSRGVRALRGGAPELWEALAS